MKSQQLDEVSDGVSGDGRLANWLMTLSYVLAGTAYFIAIGGSAIRVYGNLRFERSLIDFAVVLSAVNVVLFLSFFRWKQRAGLVLLGVPVWVLAYYMTLSHFS